MRGGAPRDGQGVVCGNPCSGPLGRPSEGFGPRVSAPRGPAVDQGCLNSLYCGRLRGATITVWLRDPV